MFKVMNSKNGQGVTHIKIEAKDAGQRLDRYLQRLYPNLPRTLIGKWCRKGETRLDKKRTAISAIVQEGQTLRLPPLSAELMAAEAATTNTTPLTLAEKKLARDMVIFEDNHFLALEKPSGLAVQGGSGQKQHVDRLLDAYEFIVEERPRIIHRLDRATSGVLLIARSRKVAAAMGEMFKNGEVEKAYLAWVSPKPERNEDILDFPLKRMPNGHVKVDKQRGKPARTLYSVMERRSNAALLALKPETGRMHQLRVHLQTIGCPILGDKKYGGRKASRLLLHAQGLKFKHPVTGKRMTIKSPLGGAFADER